MTDTPLLFSLENGVARLTLNRPDQLNAFNLALHAAMREALDWLEAAEDLRVVLLTGAGRAFCAGQDLQDRKRVPGAPPADLGESLEERYGPMLRRLRALPVPVVCAVNGVAAGAGSAIALACDIVVAIASARFIQSFVKVGLMPDCGGTWTLPRNIGRARALGASLTGAAITAEQAEAWGMIWRAAPDDAFQAEVEALVATFAAGPTRAYAAIKQAIEASETQGFDAQLDLERDLQRTLGFTDDYAEGVAAFMRKDTPRFTGR